MLLLPAVAQSCSSLDMRKGRAILKAVRRMLPLPSGPVMITRPARWYWPEPKIEVVETDLDLLIRDIEVDILKAHCEIRMIDAILAFNQGLPFDSIFMKGLPIHV